MEVLIISNTSPKCVSGSEWITLPCFDLNAGTKLFSHQIKIRIWVLFGFVVCCFFSNCGSSQDLSHCFYKQNDCSVICGKPEWLHLKSMVHSYSVTDKEYIFTICNKSLKEFIIFKGTLSLTQTNRDHTAHLFHSKLLTSAQYCWPTL